MDEDTGIDLYQKRYLDYHKIRRHLSDEPPPNYDAHEQRVCLKIMKGRRSQRVFNGAALTTNEIARLLLAIQLAPSSCNRRAVYGRMVGTEDEKNTLSALLVGGAGWIHTADVIMLLLADMAAYKSPAEVSYMPYLDAGFIAQNALLIAESLGIGACFVNPNIREENKPAFDAGFSEGNKFCGAIALGHYDKREVRKE